MSTSVSFVLPAGVAAAEPRVRERSRPTAAERKTVAEPTAERKTVAEPTAERKTVAEPTAQPVRASRGPDRVAGPEIAKAGRDYDFSSPASGPTYEVPAPPNIAPPPPSAQRETQALPEGVRYAIYRTRAKDVAALPERGDGLVRDHGEARINEPARAEQTEHKVATPAPRVVVNAYLRHEEQSGIAASDAPTGRSR